MFQSFPFILLLLCFKANSQVNTNNVPNKSSMNSNPLICDVEQGICETPVTTHSTETIITQPASKTIKIIYFTDPICSSCWGIEPQLRKLKLEYGAYFDLEYRMGGLLPSWDIYNSGGISKPSDVAHHWDEVSRHYDMPIDGDVWLEDPLPSSYPPSIAFKAAQMQDPAKAVLFLRKLRELLFLQKKNITRWAFVQQAATAAGLDPVQLKADYEGDASRLFQADLSLAQQLGVRGFPTLLLSNTAGQESKVYGFRPYEEFEQAILKLDAQAVKKEIDTSWEGLFGHYPTLTTKEFSVLSGKTRQDAEMFLMQLYDQKHLKVMDTKNGRMWNRE